MAGDEGLEALLASGAGVERLVPADTGGLVVVADTLRAHAARLDEGGWSLSRVEVTSWRGAASAGFGAAIEVEPARWRSAAEAFVAGAAAVEGFVAAVAAARDIAASAAQVYREYERAAAVAVLAAGVGVVTAPPSLAVGARIEGLQRAQAAGAGGVVGDAEALRRRAIALLASARSAVDAAGDLAADALGRAAEAAPAARRFWESTIRPADLVGTGHTTLDWAGMLPGVGAAPDAVNAGWYAAEGDWGQAGWSAIAMAPVVGDWLAATRRAVKAGEALSGVAPSAAARAQRVAPAGWPPTRSTARTPWSATSEPPASTWSLASTAPSPSTLASSFLRSRQAEACSPSARMDERDQDRALPGQPQQAANQLQRDLGQRNWLRRRRGQRLTSCTLYGLEVFSGQGSGEPRTDTGSGPRSRQG